ncbi:Sugar transporter STL1 [Lasiodiplodia hormozganensis]|uniref:Sugar transporter STL1 n=1 Tax=Lasiodiplodia hormozganensis TaxID=869390 RepID=A0AA39Y443_9PEZI|nr:Sugar transporter STL1 [Lasiodiplodia hormozganensis]
MAHLYDSTPDDERINAEVRDIQKINAITGGKKLTVKEFFSKGPEMNRWRATIAFCSQAFQQIGGLNLVTYYATTVFEDSLGFDAELSRLMTGCLGTEFFIAALVALFIVDRLGRRRLMLWGAIGMAISLLIVGACLSAGTKPPAYVATVFIFVYNSFFAMGYPLEKMDAIFAEAYEKNENPVWTERRVRKGEVLDVEKTIEDAENMAENRGDVPRRSHSQDGEGTNSDSDWEKSRSNQKEMN